MNNSSSVVPIVQHHEYLLFHVSLPNMKRFPRLKTEICKQKLKSLRAHFHLMSLIVLSYSHSKYILKKSKTTEVIQFYINYCF